MKAGWQLSIVILFLAGIMLAGVLGTGTSMTFVWPVYLLVGVAGAATGSPLFSRTLFTVPRWCLATVFVAASWFLIRSAVSPVAYFGREDASLVVASFLSYAVVLVVFASGLRRRLLLWTLAGLVMMNLAFALAQRIVDPAIWVLPGYERTFTDRVGGLFNHPAHFAAFLAVLVPLFVAAVISGKWSLFPRVGFAVLAFVSVAAIVASKSTAAFVGVIVGLAVLGALAAGVAWPSLSRKARRAVVVPVLSAALVAAVGALIWWPSLKGAVSDDILGRGGEMALGPVWKSAVYQSLDAPLTGTGSRTFHFYQRLHRPDALASTNGEPEFVHNEYLQVFAEYGLAGLVLILCVLVAHAGNGWRFVRAYAGFGGPGGPPLPQSDHLGMTMGALSSLVTLSLLACTDFLLHLPVFAVLAATVLAVLACPDPMSLAVRRPKRTAIPGGAFLYATRATAFACGLAMVVFGSVFVRSEWHYEKARLAFEEGSRDYRQFRHLQSARELDSRNPFIVSLSGHAHAAAVRAGMAGPVRDEALEKAERYFAAARQLYPQDIYAALGHGAVLSAQGRHEEAVERIRDARAWAPGYGNLMLAEAETHLRAGDLVAAEASYREVASATAFRAPEAARGGLELIAAWRQDGGPGERPVIADGEGQRGGILPEAEVKEISVGGSAGGALSSPRSGQEE